jgi:hypothetical protein
MNIPNPVRIVFDPASTDNYKVRAIFADPVARTLWLAWRVVHIVDEHFNDQVLSVAARFGQPPRTARELRERINPEYPVIWSSTSNFVGEDFPAWCEAALPYFTGKKMLGYAVTLARDNTVAASAPAARPKMGKCWMFSEDQLDAALADWRKARLAELPACSPVVEQECAAVEAFLTSSAARTHKMRGDKA